MAIKIPDVLSLQRGTIVTDGIMKSIIVGKDGNEYLEPVRVIRHGIRGVTAKEDTKNVSNIQRTESAKTSHNAIGVQVDFSYRAVEAKNLIFSSSDAAYRKAFDAAIGRLFYNENDVHELDEVCRRYARNILNGRWLWRNRVLGIVEVVARNGDKVFSGKGSTTSGFDNYTDDEVRLAKAIKNQLRGNDSTAIEVSGRVMFGFTGEVEVFPSQNMVTGKPKGFARSLYKVDTISRRDLLSILAVKDEDDAGEFAADMIDMGVAAIRDQKIGNAIRTIDTWYPGYESENLVIPVEPNGASIEQNDFFRKGKSAADSVLSKIDEIHPDGSFNGEIAYLIALAVRGGVFGKKAEKSEA